MSFRVRMGVPEIEARWKELEEKRLSGTLNKEESRFFKKWIKAVGLVERNRDTQASAPMRSNRSPGDTAKESGSPTWRTTLLPQEEFFGITGRGDRRSPSSVSNRTRKIESVGGTTAFISRICRLSRSSGCLAVRIISQAVPNQNGREGSVLSERNSGARSERNFVVERAEFCRSLSGAAVLTG